MSTILFVALVRRREPEGYEANFPDIPDCAAEGHDLSELLVNARQALAARLDAFENSGDAWPTATPIENIAVTEGAMPIPVDVTVEDPPIRVNVSLGERLVQRLDAAAELRGMTRSGFIAQAVRTSLGETSRVGGDFDSVGRRLQDELTALGRRINDSIGPGSPFERRMNGLDDVVYDGVRRAADGVSAAMTRRREAARRNGADASAADGKDS